MISQRAVQLSMRRLASIHPSPLTRTSALTRLPTPAAIATHIQSRPTSTTPISSSTANSILAEQRRHRPISPHLGIYRPQITWYASGLNRLTGITLSGLFYLFGATYLVAPLLGWHLESASLAAAFAAWPVVAKVGLKTVLAWPFTFHCWNGLRHLTWDLGLQFTNQQVIRSGWTVVGLSAVSALGLVAFV